MRRNGMKTHGISAIMALAVKRGGRILHKLKKALSLFHFGRNPDGNFTPDLFERDDLFPGEETMEVFSDMAETADWQDGPGRRFEFPDEEEYLATLSSRAFPEEKSSERSEEILQDWEGVVDEVDEEGKLFTARLRDLVAGEIYPSRMAEIPIGDVSDDDRRLLRSGAVFYLTAGRALRKGRREMFGRIVFRRLPNRTPADLRRVEERARRLIDFLEPEN